VDAEARPDGPIRHKDGDRQQETHEHSPLGAVLLMIPSDRLRGARSKNRDQACDFDG